ncbi:MAG: hypothetical protein M5U12_24800 [Verrucomicrobia bacterium]|nr:hypothetical protein [Verrucomicrobiota bacterium]
MDVASNPTTGALARPRHVLRRLYDWTVGWAERPGSTWALFAIAFIESSVFPVPPDVLLLALSVGRRGGRFGLPRSVRWGRFWAGCWAT